MQLCGPFSVFIRIELFWISPRIGSELCFCSFSARLRVCVCACATLKLVSTAHILLLFSPLSVVNDMNRGSCACDAAWNPRSVLYVSDRDPHPWRCRWQPTSVYLMCRAAGSAPVRRARGGRGAPRASRQNWQLRPAALTLKGPQDAVAA